MSLDYSLSPEIDLHVRGRISADDATRQARTAAEILRRLQKRPGQILADEVGMGKTFVALAVAVSVALQNRGKRPVVVMTPSSLKEKWPSDFALFCEKCLPRECSRRVRSGRAERAVQFLKLLDDPPPRRKNIIFLTHGAMSRGLRDPWVRLALIGQSLCDRHDDRKLKGALCRYMADLLQTKRASRVDPETWRRFLESHPSEWLAHMHDGGMVEEPEGAEEIDDPVPQAVWEVLPKLNTDEVFDALYQIPRRKSKHYKANLRQARQTINDQTRKLWKDCLRKLRLRLPLLVLDEAHHVKNANTRLASLFRAEDAQSDAEEVSRGPLAGAFERMLFLTATPFQLGHDELCSVLDRFDGIRWKGATAPTGGRAEFEQQKRVLRSRLDAAQEAAVTLDHTWSRLQEDDLTVADRCFSNVDAWWPAARQAKNLPPTAADVVRCFDRAKHELKAAETQLRQWVIRHLKPRHLPGDDRDKPRRERFAGRSIRVDVAKSETEGLPISGEALLPFLLAARAASQAPADRPVFAEGLASSYEAFLHTRRRGTIDNGAVAAIDADDEEPSEASASAAANWYLRHLEELIPQDGTADVRHPKVSATVERVVDLWRQGEKVVVFCHFVATGKILRQRLSEAIQNEILRLGAEKLSCPANEVADRLDRIGKRFFDADSPVRRACDQHALQLVRESPDLESHSQELVEIVRRNLRTPSFLVRYFPMEREELDEIAIEEAMASTDSSGLMLRNLLRHFFRFLVERCGEAERVRYIDAVKRIQTGTHFGTDATQEYADDELQGARPEQLSPNVRLVNGSTRSETRQRLMLTFNTPFYPDILVASSVMAEGVDLHLNCRSVIHHDLSWNPSTLEQRTGRVDRIGAKAETAGQPIHIYLPFIAETQDEKMYRVVMDRERWFSVVMGEDYEPDARTTEKLANRVPFPAAAAVELAFELSVAGSGSRPNC